MNNAIYIRRKRKLIISPSTHKLSDEYIATLLKNLESLGFTLSPEIVAILETFSIEEIDLFHKQTSTILKEMLGAHVQYKPMYPNFPKQVMKASDAELYTNAILHYLGDAFGVRILPKYRKNPRGKLMDTVKLKMISLGSIEDFEAIFTNLVSAKTAISETDKSDVSWFIETYKDDISRLLPKDIPLKENVALLGALLLKHTSISEVFLKTYAKIATDILRLITALSDGDVSLAENTKFMNIPRKVRKQILSMMEQIGSITEDMLRYKEQWKRVGERLHPHEYKEKFPKTCTAFDVIRNDKPFETFNSKVELLLKEKNIHELVQLLKNRPGELARKLDVLLRLTDTPQETLEVFESVADKVSSPVLLQLYAHFKHRNEPHDLRVFFPKGNVSKVQAIENTLPKLEEVTRQKVVELCKLALRKNFAQRKPLGKVYIDKELKRFMVPFALRSAAKALKTIPRGSKLVLPEGNTIRFFIWWKDGESRTDIDLSMQALDANHLPKATIAYYNLREMGGYHSGDITSAPKGASEFIDIDIEAFRGRGVRYIAMIVNAFTQQPFCDLPECFAGFMIRQQPNSGEVFEPKTVENKMDLTSNTKMSIPMIIDLEGRRVIWTDLALTSHPLRANNVASNLPPITLMNKAMTSLVKPTLLELFELHAEARGEQVFSKKEADTIFDLKDGLTPFDTDSIIAEYL